MEAICHGTVHDIDDTHAAGVLDAWDHMLVLLGLVLVARLLAEDLVGLGLALMLIALLGFVNSLGRYLLDGL